MTAAFAEVKRGSRDAGRALFEKAAAACEQQSDFACAGRAYNELGFMAAEDGVSKEVSRWHGRAAEAFARAGDLRAEAMAIRAITFDFTMAPDERIRLLERAEALAVRANEHFARGLILHHRGDVEFAAGRYAESQKHLEEALPILQRGNRPDAIARLLTSLGRSFRAHGQPERAIPLYQRALEILRQAGDLPGQAQTLNAMSIAYQALEQRKAAVAASREALELARRSGQKAPIAARLNGLAYVLATSGNYHEAISLALMAAENVGPSVAEAYLTLATAYLGLRRHQEALDAAETALARAGSSNIRETVYYAHWRRALALEGLRRVDDAIEAAENAVQTLESLRGGLVPDDALKQGFAENNRDVYAALIRLLLRAGRHSEALTVAERGRARAFLDLLVTKSIADEVGTRDVLLTRLRNPADGPLRSFMSADPLRLDDLRMTATRLDSHVISYWIDRDAVSIWVLAPDGEVHGRRVPAARARIERLVRTTAQQKGGTPTRGEVDDQPVGQIEMDPAARTAYRELYDLLIQPVRRWLPRRGDARLTIIPHGSLFRLSFAALTNERGQYLVEGYSVHYSPSLGILGLTASRPRTHHGSYLMVADPDAPGSDGVVLPPLPAARREVNAIAQVVGPQQTTRLVGRQADEADVRRLAADAGVLHFATHGIVSDDQPFASFLALERRSPDASADGRLTAREIYDMDVKARLVVLSGCRTARGKVTGDGVLGLTRAFLYAGAPSLVATLWDIYDESGVRLMPTFYREWQRSGNAADALRHAQLAVIRDLRAGKIQLQTAAGAFTIAEHPAFWAGFVVVGEP
jgi:CHAT domain-containing protein/tetratricopeptide (TPR) repeat protein